MLSGVARLLEPLQQHRVPAALLELEAAVELEVQRVIRTQLPKPPISQSGEDTILGLHAARLALPAFPP